MHVGNEVVTSMGQIAATSWRDASQMEQDVDIPSESE